MSKVAEQELALFFNNNTISFGMDALEAGMTKEKALEALVDAGFDLVLAEAFLKKMQENVNIWWVDGSLCLP